MDFDEYVVEALVRERVAEIRAAAAQRLPNATGAGRRHAGRLRGLVDRLRRAAAVRSSPAVKPRPTSG